ncbi:MAG: release factor glutamine methyltransferase [Arenicella sp.]|jgi:release factor glutamine methyltransferase
MFADNSIKGVRTYLQDKLKGQYSEREISIFAEMILDKLFGLSKTDMILNEQRFSESELLRIRDVYKRLQLNEPIQHILGTAHFYGYDFEVNTEVLIPRPETEELVDLILKNHEGEISLLDIGTGSGCIPICLKLRNPSYEISAIDISSEALVTAKRNAENLEADVNFIESNVLEDSIVGQFDVIVSNPPYVLESDKTEMQESVLSFEPGLALFVPDNDPLKFYKRIAELSRDALAENGRLYFEIHEDFGNKVKEMLEVQAYQDVNILKDLQGKDRIVSAIK